LQIEEIKVLMPPEELSDFRNFLLDRGSEELEPQRIHEISGGFAREPIIIGLVVAFGGPILVKQFASLAKAWLELRSKERVAKMNLVVKLAGGGSRDLSVSELEAIARQM